MDYDYAPPIVAGFCGWEADARRAAADAELVRFCGAMRIPCRAVADGYSITLRFTGQNARHRVNHRHSGTFIVILAFTWRSRRRGRAQDPQAGLGVL